MVDPSHSFHVADYIVFGITIVVSIGIGIYYAMAGDRQRTTSEYLVGGRTMKFLPVAISLMVSFESSIMMLGLPAEMYVYGVQWWLSCVGFLVSQVLSIFIVVPLLHPLKVTSAYEYLQLRFNSTAVRLLGSFLGMLIYVWYMGIVLFGPAIALEAVTGFSQWSSIFVVATVAVIYTSIGGIKAVIWTDVFQAFVMYAGMFAILIKGTLDVGGTTKVWEIAREGGRLEFFNFDPDPRTRHTFWNLVFGTILRGFGLAFNQSTIQRLSSTRSQREAKLVMLITAPSFFLSLTMACYEGIVAYAYYQTMGCDPLASKKIFNPNQIIPITVMDIFSNLPGLPGLFLASLFSASLSTLSSGLSSLSALMWADFLKPRLGEISDMKATIIAKISVVVFGLLGCAVAILVSTIGGTLTQITTSLLAAFGGPLTGLFFLGCFCPWVNSKGAFTGGLLSVIFSSWLSLGTNFSKSVKKSPWLPLASTDQCAANHNAFFGGGPTTVSGVSLAILNESHYAYDSVYGFQFQGDASSTAAASVAYAVLESTTAEDILETGPQGVDVLYTLSYQWLAPLGIVTTMTLGCIISALTGGNKEGDVHPRYVINFCDHFCCYLPECLRKMCRCGDDYSTVKEELPPIHDLFLDKEFTVSDTVDNEGEDHFPPGTLTLITEMEMTSHQEVTSTGSDVQSGQHVTKDANAGTGEEKPQNGSTSVDRSAAPEGDDIDDGDVTKVNVEGDDQSGGEEKAKREEEEEKEKEEGADPAENLLQAGAKDRSA